MSEVKTEVNQLQEGIVYTPGPDEYLVTPNHTLSDLLRFCIDQAGSDGKSEVQYLLDGIVRDASMG